MSSDAWWERNRGWAPYPLTAVLITLFFTGRYAVEAYAGLFRLISGGTQTVMAIAGWVLYLAPFVLLWALVLTGGRSTVCLGLLLLLTPIALGVFPGDYNQWLAEAVSGPGGNAFVVGMLNGCLAGLVVSVTIWAVRGNERLRSHLSDRALGYLLIVLGGAFTVATLAGAVIRAQS